MNKSVKIILLIVAIIAAIGGVMAFYRTIVSPPSHLKFKNQYVEAVRQDIADIKTWSQDSLEVPYQTIVDEVSFMWRDSLLTNQERDELLEKFAVEYVPAFVSSCNSKFSQSVWEKSSLQQMSVMIDQLRSLTSSGGTTIVGGDANGSLSEVQNVISNYYAAWGVASRTGYSGLSNAKAKIASANRYAEMSPINNCVALVNQLRAVPQKLEQSHYAYLKRQVNKLRYYYNYTLESYINLKNTIFSEIEEYDKDAQKVYGTSTDTRELKDYASALFDIGKAYINGTEETNSYDYGY